MTRFIVVAFYWVMLTVSLVFGANDANTKSKVEPFGASIKIQPIRQLKPVEVKPQIIDCMNEPNSSRWVVEVPPWWKKPVPDGTMRIVEQDKKRVLRIMTSGLEPELATVRVLLPGDGKANGNVWAKGRASYISFLCKSDRAVKMTFHLLQRGKSAGTFQTGFVAKPGEWQQVILPIEEFGLKSFTNIAGIGVRTISGEPNASVQMTDFQVGGMPFSDNSWKTRQLTILLRGNWLFATDPGELGMAEKWFDDSFDDSKWQVLQSGQSWQQQGVEHYGWGWYRQQIFVPKEYDGTPLTLDLTSIPADDDAWFNGTHIGGISGEYKYKNQISRVYTVPSSLIRYGENNTIAIRIWGGNITFIGDKSGLIKGQLKAELDPFIVQMREPGKKAVPASLFDLSEAQRGKEFEILFSFPADIAKEPGAQLHYRFTDYLGQEILSGISPIEPGSEGRIQSVVKINPETAQNIYLHGRFRAGLLIKDVAGIPLYSGNRDLDHLLFASRDKKQLPVLPEKIEETPYGKLKLIDEIDCTTSLFDEPHPYLQGGFDNKSNWQTPGSTTSVRVVDILGKKARESEYGWFGYRVGRGKLKPHSTYLLRIEYPEDKPRFAPIEIQTGQNYVDVGWKNGVGANDVYDPWPLSQKWQYYDVIVPLDDQTVGTGGTGSANAENGFWVYFMNKMRPGMYYAMWEGGPAVAKIKLYEIDPEKNVPIIQKPANLPNRVLSFDWERQPDHNPVDLVRYAKLMGYNAISPVILKWFFANYSDPINGYDTMTIDAQDYWAHKEYDPESGKDASSPYPERKSQHVRYLEATKQYGINYIPRVEWGGSKDLSKEAWALDVNGKPTKPNRFAPWCANLLNSQTWEDLKKFMDRLIKPYTNGNPQLTGVLWRIRCNRMPISYGPDDIKLFCKETNTELPGGTYEQWAAWVTGDNKSAYDAWWHKKRADFHIKLSNLLKSYRSDMTLYYYNWDPDKFGIIEPDITAWGFVANVIKPAPEGGRAAYEKERAVRKTFTAKDYIYVMKSGDFGKAFYGLNRADLGIRPELYKNSSGIQIFAPVNYLCYADKPEYLNYFQTADGLAISNCVSYDEIGARSINPKYEGNMITPGGAPFSMALELLSYFYGDARTLNYTVYTYGRGFADAHRRFAQAFLALPAIQGTVVEQNDPDLKVRIYPSVNGTYIGVAYKGYVVKKFAIEIPADNAAMTLQNLVTNQIQPSNVADGKLRFELESGPMELNAFLLK